MIAIPAALRKVISNDAVITAYGFTRCYLHYCRPEGLSQFLWFGAKQPRDLIVPLKFTVVVIFANNQPIHVHYLKAHHVN